MKFTRSESYLTNFPHSVIPVFFQYDKTLITKWISRSGWTIVGTGKLDEYDYDNSEINEQSCCTPYFAACFAIGLKWEDFGNHVAPSHRT